MDYLTCLTVNGLIFVLIIVANAFFTFCMVCPFHGERIKQPLKLLLWSLIFCTTTFLASIFVMNFSETEDDTLTQLSYSVLNWALFASMYSSVWLNFFYYTQIVPAQRGLFIWIKKNIKRIIYSIWVAERIYSCVDVSVNYLVNIYSDGLNNSTMDEELGLDASRLEYLVDITAVIGNSYFYFCLCIMVMSSGSTVVYLCRHMHRMAANGQSLSCPRFICQVRVTGTGILQGVLYVFYSLWTSYITYSSTVMGPCSNYIVLNFYMAGTTFSLGAGQAVFRQRAADMWLRAAQRCRASKVQQSERGGQNPVDLTNM